MGNNRPWERAACAAAWALSALASWLGVEVGGGEGRSQFQAALELRNCEPSEGRSGAPQTLVWCHHGCRGRWCCGSAERAALGVVPQSVRGNNRDSALGNSNIQEEGRSRSGLRDGRIIVHPSIQQTCIECLLCARYCSRP